MFHKTIYYLDTRDGLWKDTDCSVFFLLSLHVVKFKEILSPRVKDWNGGDSRCGAMEPKGGTETSTTTKVLVESLAVQGTVRPQK